MKPFLVKTQLIKLGKTINHFNAVVTNKNNGKQVVRANSNLAISSKKIMNYSTLYEILDKKVSEDIQVLRDKFNTCNQKSGRNNLNHIPS